MRGLGSGHVTCGPMRGLEKNCMGRGQTDTQTDRQTNGHCDSMTESAQCQWAHSVKMQKGQRKALFEIILRKLSHVTGNTFCCGWKLNLKSFIR